MVKVVSSGEIDPETPPCSQLHHHAPRPRPLVARRYFPRTWRRRSCCRDYCVDRGGEEAEEQREAGSAQGEGGPAQPESLSWRHQGRGRRDTGTERRRAPRGVACDPRTRPVGTRVRGWAQRRAGARGPRGCPWPQDKDGVCRASDVAVPCGRDATGGGRPDRPSPPL